MLIIKDRGLLMGHADSKRDRKEIIEHMLRHTRDGFTMEEMANRAGCSIPTVSRYLKEFEPDLIKTDYGRYKLNPTKFLSTVRFSQLEALSTYLALRRFIRQTTSAPQFMVTALEKISNVLLPDELQEQLFSASRNLQQSRPASQEERAIWERLFQAWQDKVIVIIEYAKPRTQEVTIHEFEPYLFEPAILSHGTYVIGWSRTREALRTLKINRIQRVTFTPDFFEAPERLQVDDLLKHAWAVWYGQELVRVELRFVPIVAERVLETIWHPSQQTQLNNDGSLNWIVEVASTLELVPWIRGWGHEVEVLAPANLRQEIAESLRAAAGLYEED